MKVKDGFKLGVGFVLGLTVMKIVTEMLVDRLFVEKNKKPEKTEE